MTDEANPTVSEFLDAVSDALIIGVRIDEACRTRLLALARRGAAVPDEATEEMLVAAGKAPGGVTERGGTDWLGKMLPKYWSAMLRTALKAALEKP